MDGEKDARPPTDARGDVIGVDVHGQLDLARLAASLDDPTATSPYSRVRVQSSLGYRYLATGERVPLTAHKSTFEPVDLT